ncbi:MAG: hypothetical protein R8P61_09480 [Bacteroidia bacterium]|nr:hypothetical protein [Bacteroidia bacterium]
MLDHQRYYLILLGALALIGGTIYLALPQLSYASGKLLDAEKDRWERHELGPRNVSVLHVDFTQSDTTIALKNGPYRKLLTQVLKKDLHSERDVMAAYLVHNETHNNQPFYATHSVLMDEELLNESAGNVVAQIHQDMCLERFDSLSNLYAHQEALVIEDSSLMRYTNVIGALQNAANYFRRYAIDKDQKKVYFLSDMRENSVFLTPVARVDNLTAKDQIDSLVQVSLHRLSNLTDVESELEGAEIYILTPNEHLYSSKGRNFTRMFWEKFFLEELQCKSVFFQ